MPVGPPQAEHSCKFSRGRPPCDLWRVLCNVGTEELTMSGNHATESFKEALADLGRARDQAKLKLHLLSLDAQSKWTELEGKIENLERSAEHEFEKAANASASN